MNGELDVASGVCEAIGEEEAVIAIDIELLAVVDVVGVKESFVVTLTLIVEILEGESVITMV